MNSFLVTENGVKLQMDDDLFDLMWKSIKNNEKIDYNKKKKKQLIKDLMLSIKNRDILRSIIKIMTVALNVTDAGRR